MTPAKDILIVDDEVGIRELLSEILADEGYRVSLAENATEARAYPRAAAALAGAARHLDAGHRRRDAAARVVRRGPADDAGGDDVRPRHDRDGGRGDQDRRLRLPREADRPAEAPRHGRARAQGGDGTRAAPRLAGRARVDGAGARGRARAGAAPGRASSDPRPRRAGHRSRRRGARAGTARRPLRHAGERCAARRQPAGGARGGARRRPLLRRDRPVHQGRAEGARVPAAQARARQRHAGVHQRRGAGQPRVRRALRPGAAVGAVLRRA